MKRFNLREESYGDFDSTPTDIQLSAIDEDSMEEMVIEESLIEATSLDFISAMKLSVKTGKEIKINYTDGVPIVMDAYLCEYLLDFYKTKSTEFNSKANTGKLDLSLLISEAVNDKSFMKFKWK